MTGYTAAEQTNIMVAVAGAFLRLRDGSNSVGDFNTLANAINIGLVRSESMDRGTEEVFQRTQQALLRADQIYESLRVYTFTPAELVDLAKGVHAYSDVLKRSTEQQMKAAIEECERRLVRGMHAKLAGLTH